MTRDVKIIETAETFIMDSYIQLAPDNKELIEVSVALNGENKANQKITIAIPEAEIEATCTSNEQGIAKTTIKAKNLKLWSSESPKLYDVNLNLNGEILSDKIGFRTLNYELRGEFGFRFTFGSIYNNVINERF